MQTDGQTTERDGAQAVTPSAHASEGAAAGDRTVIRGIGQIAIRVSDVPRAVEFYRDVMGLRYLFEAGHMAFFDCGGVRLMLTQPETAEFDHPASIVYYTVADLEAAHARMAAAGASFETAPHRVADLGRSELWMAFFRDPDANVAALMSEVEKS